MQKATTQVGANATSLVARVIHRLRAIKNRWVQPVPDDRAACEFECRRETCDAQNWQSCPTRRTGSQPK